MWHELKRQWAQLRSARPGRRFQDRYERNRNARAGKSVWNRFVEPVLGIVLVLGGIALLFIPGPGLPLLFIGAGLLASRSRAVAMAMDWIELHVRRVLRSAAEWWRELSALAKKVIVILATCALLGAGYEVWQILFGS